MGARRIVKKQPVKQQPTERWMTPRLLGGSLLVSVVGGLLGFTVWQLSQVDTLPIQQVQVKGEFRYLDEKSLYEKISGLTQAGFFNVDVRSVKEAAEEMPWVDSASVRRIWPDTLRIDIREQVPLARWSQGGMVNRRGELVSLVATEALSNMPSFSGPRGAAKVLAERYQHLSAALGKVELSIAALALSERRAWQVSLNNGVELLLGRAAFGAQLTRFTNVYRSELEAKQEKIQSVDLRYTNGFAVRWKSTDLS